MSSPEFDLIQRFFTEQAVHRSDVLLGIGDDAALLSPPPGAALSVSTDTLIAGVHFPENTSARAIGYKALAVNLSDLAAMGAEPAWVTLAISLPENNAAWLSEFARGFFELATEFGVQLVGGDTTRGPLSITVQVTGFVPPTQALTRSGAQAGDAVFLTGTLGDAGLGLQLQQQSQTSGDALALIQRLDYPTPRVAAGLALRDIANSAIDISDGLAADLGHVLVASGVGADIDIDCLPLSSAFLSVASADAWQQAVSAGDDYELCFTAPQAQQADVLARLQDICPCVRIGTISAQVGLRWRDAQQNQHVIEQTGFDHFSGAEQ
jgi:thiamine-monophosphate kinase